MKTCWTANSSYCWNYTCIIELYWTSIFHKKLSSLMFRLFCQFRVSYHKTWWKCVPSRTLSFILTYNFDKILINSLVYVIQFLQRLVFQMKNMASKRKLMWKIADIVAISATKPYAEIIDLLKTCELYKTFQVFI